MVAFRHPLTLAIKTCSVDYRIERWREFSVEPIDLPTAAAYFRGMGTKQAGRRAAFRKGEVIFREGESGACMYLVRAGKVLISRRVLDIEKRLDTLSRGDYFGEMALIEALPRSATATALTKVVLECVDEREFLRLMGHGGSMAMTLLREMSARLREADRQIETLLLADEEGRVVHTLSNLATAYGRKTNRGVRLSRKFSTADIGDMANVSTKATRAVLDRLIQGGFIRLEGERMVLKSKMALDGFLNYMNWREKAFR